MPPWFYLPMHPAAKLTDAEKQALEDGAGKSPVSPERTPKALTSNLRAREGV